MTAINSGIHEVPGVRIPLQTNYASPPHAVFMYSTTSEGVTLQLRDSDDIDDKSGLASVLARLQQEDTTLSISYQETEMLTESNIDVLLGTTVPNGTNRATTFDFFDAENGHDLTLSPQTFTSSTEAFINDNSDSLGVPGEADAGKYLRYRPDERTMLLNDLNVGSTEDVKTTVPDSSKLSVKKPRPKASSPNRQGPQQCQVCGKVFGNASALAKHKLTHSDERKYVCSMCGKAFKRQDHLNGHMLTHRNKKPYECKAEGCGKSYCDARSLRRHTENHHTGGGSGSGGGSGNSGSGGGGNREVSSPHASGCIQYAPPTSQHSSSYPSSTSPASSSTTNTPTKPPSQLQQLLASDSTTSATSSSSKASNSQCASNEGLTKHQLDLIHQIMQQTTHPKHHKTSSSSGGGSTSNSSGSTNGPAKSSAAGKAKTWTVQSPAFGGAKGNISTSSQGGQGGGGGGGGPKGEQKPVECTLCHRKFKNVPALNGHMRLHGGYFKKDSDNKKCEKKELNGPPLQTASMSVRALIEEKIIQKRSTNSQNMVTITSEGGAVRNVSRHLSSTAVKQEPDLNIKLSSFVVPAPPQSTIPSAEKLRRHSDSEHFLPPRAPSGIQPQEAQALAEILLKRGKKISVKRASSDPGALLTPGSPLQLSTNSSPGPPLQLSFQPPDFALSGVTYQTEDGSYFTSNLQEDVFQQVSADTMLLQGVDASQLTESLQFQTSLLQDHADALVLEEYQGPNTQDLHAVFNSPLPVNLGEFTTYGNAQNQSPKEMQYHQDSPLHQTKEFVAYVNSPHPNLANQSPIHSPITHHDSPSFTYPTPPASQEGHSPSFGQGLLSGTLRISSPQQINDGFMQSVIAHGGGPVPASSPLTTAFYTAPMSSAAAVEAALSEVLPMDNQTTCNGPVRMNMYQSSPPAHSPLSGTPVPSPLSLSSVPASSSSVSSPMPQAAFNNNQNHNSFPLSPHQTLQNQMMPNSDDPLLSSSPKDFGSRKRFDFNGIHSFKLIGNGMVDLGNGSLGIMVDSNGELKIFQATSHQPSKNLVMSGATIINSATGTYVRKVEGGTPIRISGTNGTPGQHFTISQNVFRAQRPKVQVTLENVKEEVVEDEPFVSPSSVPPSPSRPLKRGHSATTNGNIEPFVGNTFSRTGHQSKIRAPRLKDLGTPPPFTPAPMLSPTRPGQGLYWQAAAPATSCSWPTSTTVHPTSATNDRNEFSDEPVESDARPHINVGSKFQAVIPKLETDLSKLDREPSYEHLLWDPGIGKLCTESEIEMYLEFACCAAVPGGGRNKEYALHLLNMCHGNIHEAMLKLMQPTPWLPPGHPLLAYEYAESDRWSADEVDAFHQGLLKFDKDFQTIAHEIGTKTIKQCIQFYYLWKKICPEEYKRLRLLRRRKESEPIKTEMDLEYEDIKVEPDIRQPSPPSDADLVSTSSESRLFVCEYTDCSASFNSRAALSGHIRIHGGTLGGRASTPDRRGSGAGNSVEEFPCKICGKIFNKVKSRSAHMKSHRPPDAEPKKPKLDSQHKLDIAEQAAGRTGGVSSSSISVSRLT